MKRAWILSLSCADQPGIVAAVTGNLAAAGCNILEAEQFDDLSNRRFFMRIVFDPVDSELESLREGLAPVALQYGMDWRLRDTAIVPKVLILVSKFDHCLVDLLYRKRIGEIAMDVVGIVSNHSRDGDHPRMLDGIPFHHCPITRETKAAQEAEVKRIITDSGAELVVLARYMQILSDDMAKFLSGRCINIHHSFLPGFKGAKPYHQAFERGVKMIGATGHYVTADLDEGPIIAQDVEAISHRAMPEELVAKGRDVERRVLARAVKAHLENRVFFNGNRTVVFGE
ncbi:formyltetrahydrofolate deformylase [Novosphingobium sp. AAP83]|uniref:formyltetrahydrofolate deformylase n=1 Tax=Novosphingobium sp. AAP83 TaxID=1523425 RepID=UPI0006B9C425|nr:formyltetrahydrofolate deformylase [Novosphingobium sp. AAP83]KPF88568.1 formyltetrahydrofolate deformylase [Novosphingobium sp. AAP83]